MVERRKKKKNEVIDAPSNVELKIAKYIRFNTPKKSVIIQKEQKEYFTGSKAVDTLLASKWGKSGKKSEVLFKTREDCANFLNFMMDNKMFYRGLKVLKEPKTKDEKKKESKEDSEKSTLRKRKKDDDNEKDESKTEKVDKKGELDPEKKDEEKKTKKRRYRIEINEEQYFYDTNDIYVWLYEPLSTKTLLLGCVVLIGVVLATLFPLWPPTFRVGVYYVSVAAGLFVGSVLGTAFLRSILFVIIWLCTAGKYHVWFLPNLLADVGFFESFKPWWTVDCYPSADSTSEDTKKKKDETKEETATKDETCSAKESASEEHLEEDSSQASGDAVAETAAPHPTDDLNDSAECDNSELTIDQEEDKSTAENITHEQMVKDDAENEADVIDDTNNDYVIVDSPNQVLS